VGWAERAAVLHVRCVCHPEFPPVLSLLLHGRVSDRISFERFIPGMRDTILYPVSWKALPEIKELRQCVSERRQEVLEVVRHHFGAAAGIPIEAYAAIALLAQELEGFGSDTETTDKILHYTDMRRDYEYVSI
jgi:hypothetical protein